MEAKRGAPLSHVDADCRQCFNCNATPLEGIHTGSWTISLRRFFGGTEIQNNKPLKCAFAFGESSANQDPRRNLPRMKVRRGNARSCNTDRQDG
jgi:hypothetical protein